MLLIPFTFLLCSSHRILAVNLFYDDFSSGDLSKWEVSPGDTYWSVGNDFRLKSELTYRQSSVIYANNTSNLTDYRFDINLENHSGIDQHIVFRVSDDKNEFYELELRYPDNVWPQGPSNIVRLWRHKSDGYSMVIPDVSFNLAQDVANRLEVVVDGVNIKVYVNNVLVINKDEDLADAILKGGVGLRAYAGDYNPGSIINYYDDVSVSTIKDSIRPKIILLPGLGASWNTEAMVSGKTGNDIVWKMTPFVHNYDRLIQGFKDNGLKENEDFFVFNYDWRRPLNEIVDNLNKFINLKIKTGDKVDLVGHSLGAVVSRIWTQDHLDDARLNMVVGMAGPQMGSLEAYTAWNGVNLGGNVNYYDVALNVVSLLNKGKSVRAFSPVLKDLLPIFDFVKVNGQKKSFNSLTFVNSYLLSKNIGYSGIFSVVGIGETTKEWLNLTTRTALDKALGLWEDGSFKGVINGNGDGSVLVKSGAIGSTETITSNHGDIIDKSVNDVLTKLNLGTTVSGSFDNNLKNKLFLLIGSPATISLTCDGQSYGQNDNDGFLVTDASDKKNCEIKLTGTESGTYHLVTGKIGDQNSWHYFENEIGVGQTNIIHLTQGNGQPQCSNDNFYYELVKRDLNVLLQSNSGNKHLLEALRAISKKDNIKLINELFEFRRQAKETITTNRIIDNLRLLFPCKYKDDKFSRLKWAGFKMWNGWFSDGRKNDIFGVRNYQKMEEIDDGTEDNYEAKLILMNKLGENVL